MKKQLVDAEKASLFKEDMSTLLEELEAATKAVSEAALSWSQATFRMNKAVEACAKAGVLPCQFCKQQPAIKRHRCGRWYCSEKCHDISCHGYFIDPEEKDDL